MLFTFGTKFNDSFGNGYGLTLNDMPAVADSSYQGDGHIAKADLPMAVGGTIKNLLVDAKLYTLNAPLLVKVYVNGVDSGVGVTITAAGQVSDNINTVAVNAGDYVSIGTDPTTSTVGNYRVVGTVELA